MEPLNIAPGGKAVIDGGNLDIDYLVNPAGSEFQYTLKAVSKEGGVAYQFSTEGGDSLTVRCPKCGEISDKSFNSSMPNLVFCAKMYVCALAKE